MVRIHYLTTAAVFALGLAGQASAAIFVTDSNAGADGTKLFLTAATDSTSSTGSVAAANDVNITVVGASDFANGSGAIRPVTGGSLTEVTFTPVNASEFDSFSFRGQSLAANQTVQLIVTDNQGDAAQTIDFSIAKKNADFGPFGVISTDGGTIKSVELLLPTGFKQAKQFQFDCVVTSASCPNNGGAGGGAGGGAIPEPATWALMLVGVAGLGGVMRLRRREPAAA